MTEPLGGDMLVDCAVGERKLLVKTTPDYAAERGALCYLTFDTVSAGTSSPARPVWPTLTGLRRGEPKELKTNLKWERVI